MSQHDSSLNVRSCPVARFPATSETEMVSFNRKTSTRTSMRSAARLCG